MTFKNTIKGLDKKQVKSNRYAGKCAFALSSIIAEISWVFE